MNAYLFCLSSIYRFSIRICYYPLVQQVITMVRFLALTMQVYFGPSPNQIIIYSSPTNLKMLEINSLEKAISLYSKIDSHMISTNQQILLLTIIGKTHFNFYVFHSILEIFFVSFPIHAMLSKSIFHQIFQIRSFRAFRFVGK